MGLWKRQVEVEQAVEKVEEGRPAEEGGERGGKVGELVLQVESGARGEEGEVYGGGGGQEGGARHKAAGAGDQQRKA